MEGIVMDVVQWSGWSGCSACNQSHEWMEGIVMDVVTVCSGVNGVHVVQ